MARGVSMARDERDEPTDRGLAAVYAEIGYNPQTGKFEGGLLRACVFGRQLTIAEFCELAGITEDTFANIEKGGKPRGRTIIKILQALARVPPIRILR